MVKRILVAAVPLAMLMLAGCHSGPKGGVFASRKGVPDEFAVGRAAPLTVPPDFALVPPKPGQPRPQEADSSAQALNALFGGQRGVSAGETALTAEAGPTPPPGIRSEAGDPNTTTVNKGADTQAILKAPPSTNPAANASTPK
ncbi:DUF3035 domain-containing protein [Sphingomonas crusticola]|uniref:DUF3035 domain-containing protein n=1 Tax=Sphingomonas crusticola TaxID=1697973 RepID=UPI000E24F883|nr:DUF3035 domain-containing protein [Sphingomonas crusticola]